MCILQPCNVWGASLTFLAVAPPPPKQFTDEELKQQYGIHLATRLQADESSGKSKWADIDEDEDDWAPEAVEWMDGTKSSLVPTDNQPPAPEPVKAAVQTEEPPQPPKPTLTIANRQSSLGPTKMILRPGAVQQAKQSGISPKGEKPTLVAKASGPLQMKSPWAPLPPVEKVSPVVINPPPQSQPQPSPSYFRQEPHGFDAMPQPYPAREIAADTFDRSWREGERPGRELFNAQSNRYEPAPEHRRGSAKHDHTMRQPALLQRSSQTNASGPAEPSAAFQTSRSSGQMDGATWSRRRGSSVSGGSSLPPRRASIQRGSEASNDARNATVIGHDMAASPQAQTAQPATFGAQFPWQQQMPAPPPAGSETATSPSFEDEIARQKELMREKRDAAIKRRKEEEEREEAAKRERIRQKMEALGMAPLESKQEKPETPGPEKQVERQAQMDKAAKTAPSLEKGGVEDVAIPAQASASKSAELESQVQQQRQTRDNLTAQPSPGKEPNPAGPASSRLDAHATTHQLPPKPVESPQKSMRQQLSPNAPGRSPYKSQNQIPGLPTSSYSSPKEQKAQLSWKSPSLGGDLSAPWGNSGMTTHSTPGGNVWGPPSTTNSGIGNGVFNPHYSTMSPGHPQHRGGFGAPGFGRPHSNRLPSQPFTRPSISPDMHQPLSGDRQLQSDTLPSSDPHVMEPASTSQIDGVSPTPLPVRPAYQPTPIGPPQRRVPQVSRWNNFSAQAQARADAGEEPHGFRHAQEAAKPSGTTQQIWKEKYKQTAVQEDWLGGPRKIMVTEQLTHGGLPSEPQFTSTERGHSLAIGEERQLSGRENIVRLPNARGGYPRSTNGQSLLTAYQGNATASATLPLATSSAPQQSRFFPAQMYGGSPPPEEADHPVYDDGDVKHPRVSLPAPKPKVRLPPSQKSLDAQGSTAGVPQRYAFRPGAQPLVQSSDWQARFNGLFGKAQVAATTPPSPPKTPEKLQAFQPAAVTSSSKNAMDIAPARNAATVSLPTPSPPNGAVVQNSVVSKPSVNDIFDGELSFGSKPRVLFPRITQYQQTFPERLPLLGNSKNDLPFTKRIESQSKLAFLVAYDEGRPSNLVTVSIPYSNRPAKDMHYHRRYRRGIFQDRKVSTKFNKDKRNFSEPGYKNKPPKSASPVSSTKPTGSSSPRPNSGGATAAKRTTSYQKPQTPVAPEKPGIQVSNSYAALALEDEEAKEKKRRGWSRPSRARDSPARADA